MKMFNDCTVGRHRNRARKERCVDGKTRREHTGGRNARNSGDTQKELDIVLTFHDKLQRLALNQRTVARSEEKSRRH